MEEAYLYLWISAVLALIAGSILLPCHFLLDEMKSTIGTIAAYPAAAGFFVIFVLHPNHPKEKKSSSRG